MSWRKIHVFGIVSLTIIVAIGFLVPQNLKMPVVGADTNSYNHETFWHEGWGTSIVHKGVDVFAKRSTRINSATCGIVLITDEYGKGGKFVVILGPKWRLHYYAHLDEIKTKPFTLVSQNSEIGTVGNTGNAATTPAHLHYGIGSLFPYFWRIDEAPLGWQKMFYLNPIDFLQENDVSLNINVYIKKEKLYNLTVPCCNYVIRNNTFDSNNWACNI